MPYVSVRALTTDGKAMVFVDPETTVAELKLKVQETMGIQAQSQTLVYKGRDLKNAQTIEDCHIDEATSITLFNNATDIAPVAGAGSTSSNLGMAGYAMGLLVNDDIETLVGLCAENIVVYHNPSSTLAPMYGRFFGIEGFAMWLEACNAELKSEKRPRLFNFSSSGNYVMFEAEFDVSVKKTNKKLTISRLMKLMFNQWGQAVVWDIMEDSAPLAEAYKPKVFKAPDGAEFPTRRKVFQYWFNFTDKEGETLVRNPGEINGQPFDVAGCKGCTIILADYMDQVRLDDLEDCKIFIGASSESVWLRNCKNCQVTVACRELRTFDSVNIDISVVCMADPVIERSTGIRFHVYGGDYPLRRRHQAAAKIDVYKNRYNHVEDISASDAELPQPHFTVDKTCEKWVLTDEDIHEVRLAASTRVEGRYGGGTIWYPGTICKANDDGTYKILYDDGDIENTAAPEFVRTI